MGWRSAHHHDHSRMIDADYERPVETLKGRSGRSRRMAAGWGTSAIQNVAVELVRPIS